MCLPDGHTPHLSPRSLPNHLRVPPQPRAHRGPCVGAGRAIQQDQMEFPTGGRVISSRALANGMVYFGRADGNLYALDLQSGAQEWKFPTEVRVTSSPAADHGIVYCGSYSGNFYALDGATGGATIGSRGSRTAKWQSRLPYFIIPRCAIPMLSRVLFFTRYIISSAWRMTSCGVFASWG
jgi:hypothetical protein